MSGAVKSPRHLNKTVRGGEQHSSQRLRVRLGSKRRGALGAEQFGQRTPWKGGGVGPLRDITENQKLLFYSQKKGWYQRDAWEAYNNVQARTTGWSSGKSSVPRKEVGSVKQG
ncbi:hypothetical protein FRC17_000617 [Serendipita sp. 399]|nr:hypothetical protein FRC17_000617 [Serendipita sp. 399]